MPSLLRNGFAIRAFHKYKLKLLLLFGVAQLAYLVTMPMTRRAGLLLAQAVLSGNYGVYVLGAPVLLGFGVLVNQKVKALNWAWLEWSPWHIKANVALMPLQNKWLWAPYGLLLGSCMPLLAFFEEVVFRNGTTGWVRGVAWGAVAFGLFHLLSCVSLRMALYLTFVGAVLVGVYMQGGLLAVFVLHATYNLLALTLLVAEVHLKKAPAFIRAAGRNVAAAN